MHFLLHDSTKLTAHLSSPAAVVRQRPCQLGYLRLLCLQLLQQSCSI